MQSKKIRGTQVLFTATDDRYCVFMIIDCGF